MMMKINELKWNAYKANIENLNIKQIQCTIGEKQRQKYIYYETLLWTHISCLQLKKTSK